MKTKLSLIYTIILSTFVCVGYALAEDEEKMVVKLKTNDFEIAETDISDLAIGESETIITESGKTIDLLRTAEGVEIYVDGELMDIPEMGAHEIHGSHHDGAGMMHKKVIVKCEVDGDTGEDSECGNEMVFMGEGDVDIEALHEAGEGHKVIRIHKSIDGNVEVNENIEKVIVIEKD